LGGLEILTVKPTSKQAFREHVEERKARTQREIILECIRDSSVPINRNQICKLTGIRINAVTGRVNELLQKNADGWAPVRVAYEGRDPKSNRPCEYLEATTVVYRTKPDGQVQFVTGPVE
jgi:hypothetical protein